MRKEIKERLKEFDIKYQIIMPSKAFIELLESMTDSERGYILKRNVTTR